MRQSSHLFSLHLFRLHQSQTQRVFSAVLSTKVSFLPAAVAAFCKTFEEVTDKTRSSEISVMNCDEVLGMDVPAAFGGAAQKSPVLQTLKTF